MSNLTSVSCVFVAPAPGDVEATRLERENVSREAPFLLTRRVVRVMGVALSGTVARAPALPESNPLWAPIRRGRA